MTKITTKICKDALAARYGTREGQWKRVHKGRDADGVVTRLFESSRGLLVLVKSGAGDGTITSMGDDKLRLNVKWLFAIDADTEWADDDPGGLGIYLLPEHAWLAGQSLDYPPTELERQDLLAIEASTLLEETMEGCFVLTGGPTNVGITRSCLRARLLAAGLGEDRSFTDEMVSSYV